MKWKECPKCKYVHPVETSCDAYKAFLGYFGSEGSVREYMKGTDVVKVGKKPREVTISDVHQLIIRWKITKYGKNINPETRKLLDLGFSEDYIETITHDRPYEIECIAQNLLLNEGIGEVFDIIGGIGTTQLYDNTNARVGVGSDSTAEVATQTGLLDGTPTFKGMAASFPSRASQTMSWKGLDFGTGDANEAWNEFTVDNGTGAQGDLNLNRKVDTTKGTKVSGETWTLQIDVTLS